MVSVNPTTFSRIEVAASAQRAIDYYYDTYFGFAFSPAAQLVNPAHYTTKTPRDFSAKVRELKLLPIGGVRLSFATTDDDGLNVPAFVDFHKIGKQWVPTRWIYRVSGAEYEVVQDAGVSKRGFALPTQYRYIYRSKTPKMSSIRTVVLQYAPLNNQLFALEPTPQQFVTVENADSKPELVEPGSVSLPD